MRWRHVLKDPRQVARWRRRDEWKPLPILPCDSLACAAVNPFPGFHVAIREEEIACAIVEGRRQILPVSGVTLTQHGQKPSVVDAVRVFIQKDVCCRAQLDTATIS